MVWEGLNGLTNLGLGAWKNGREGGSMGLKKNGFFVVPHCVVVYVVYWPEAQSISHRREKVGDDELWRHC